MSVFVLLRMGDGVYVPPPAVQQNPRGGGGRIYPYPQEKKKKRVIKAPVPEYEVSGPLSRQTAIENPKMPKWDFEAWEASLKTLQTLEREDRHKRQKKTEAALLVWLL